MRDIQGFVFFWISLVFFIIPLSLFAIDEPPTLVDRIENAYKNISDLKGRFKQTSYLKDLEKRESYEGEFFIKIPSMFKWSYKGKSPQDVIISGDSLIIYQKKERQVLEGRFFPSRYGQAPIALLGGFGNIKRDFEIKEERDRLILKPKAQMGNIRSIEIYSGDGEFPIKRLKITDTAMNSIEIDLKDVVINSGLQDKLFEFVPPADVRVIEGL